MLMIEQHLTRNLIAPDGVWEEFREINVVSEANLLNQFLVESVYNQG